jgi:hypothetical protein
MRLQADEPETMSALNNVPELANVPLPFEEIAGHH